MLNYSFLPWQVGGIVWGCSSVALIVELGKKVFRANIGLFSTLDRSVFSFNHNVSNVSMR